MFQDAQEELKRLEQALREEEEAEAQADATEAYEAELEEEYEDGDAQEQEAPPPQDPRRLIAVVLLVTAGVLLFLAYLLARREGLI